MESCGLVVEFQLKPDCLDRFHELLAANVEASVEKEAGCLQFDVQTAQRLTRKLHPAKV